VKVTARLTWTIEVEVSGDVYADGGVDLRSISAVGAGGKLVPLDDLDDEELQVAADEALCAAAPDRMEQLRAQARGGDE
jgi:hypothetical protein